MTKEFPIGHEKNGGGEYEIIDGGVRIISRYKIPAETALMYRVLRSLPTDLHNIVEAIFCDSKVGSSYTVEVSSTSRKKAEDLANWMASRFVIFTGGFSRLSICCGDTELFTLAQCWDEERHQRFVAWEAEKLDRLGQTDWTTTYKPSHLEAAQ
jgi:hypothetical protein